jgi:nicotinamidase/pyrazinamidase
MFQISKTDALIVIDPQNDFCPGGALAVAEGDEIMTGINALSFHFAKNGGLIVVTQDWHPAGHSSFASTHGVDPFSIVQVSYGDQVAWPDHCVQGTPGAEFHPNVVDTIERAAAIVRKGMNKAIDSYSGAYENDKITPTGLIGYLFSRGIRRVFVVGLARNYCVGFTLLDLSVNTEATFDTVLVEDLTKAIPDGSNDAMTEQLIAAGVQFATTADFGV